MQVKHFIRLSSTTIFLWCILMMLSKQINASHIYGMDFFYTHVSGNTYALTVNIYGDCSATNTSTLSNASPIVYIYNGSTYYSRVTLAIQNPIAGTEITPVCPAQVNNTECRGGTIPGIKKFVYSTTVSLNTLSANWRFRLIDTLIKSPIVGIAGRSSNITNLVAPGTSLINLEATLNNLTAPNSSPTFTTIPTPFFCINKGANYNPGAVDPNTDSLSYALVPGMQPGTTVTYLTGYSATAPLAVSTGSLSASSTTGQINFIPNSIQRSLVVHKVSEFRNGVLVGTAMREMTFVVLNCSNNPPAGKITNNNAGKVDTSGTVISICKFPGTATFNINPTDQDNHGINVSSSGLPAGAVFNVTNNNSQSPTGSFSWNISSVTPGAYTFFVTYLDDGCPLSSKQTVAYTVIILPTPTLNITLNAPATCTKKAVFTMTPMASPAPWRIQVLQGSTQLHNFTNVTAAQLDSLSPGSYTLRVTSTDTCFTDTTLVIDPPPPVGISLVVTPLLCHNAATAVVTTTASGGKTPFTYAINAAAYTSVNTFPALNAGAYTLRIRDGNDCTKDSAITIGNPTRIDADITLTHPLCYADVTGVINVTGKNAVAPYTYAIGSGTYSSSGSFTPLAAGTYTLHIKDNNNCVRDTNVTITQPAYLSASISKTDISCYGNNNGIITLTGTGGINPYTYAIGSGSYSTTTTYSSLTKGVYTLHIKDNNGCLRDTTMSIAEPTELKISNVQVTNVLCNSTATGAMILTGTGGTTPYTYAIGSGSFGSSNNFSALSAGQYVFRLRDKNNCGKDSVVSIAEPARIVPSITVKRPVCSPINNGAISIGATGGVPGYTYAMGTSSFSSTTTFSPVAAGTHTMRVKDQNNCIIDTIITLPDSLQVIATSSVTDAHCFDSSTGSILISGTGGVTPYAFSISGGGTNSTGLFGSLPANSYNFTVTDNIGCTTTVSATIKHPPRLMPTLTYTEPTCNGNTDGQINVAPTGGTPAYQHAVNNGQYSSVATFSNIASGNYTISVKDSKGCTVDTSFKVTQPNTISLSVVPENLMCKGDTSGAVRITGIGGTTPYSYAYDTQLFSANSRLTGLSAGTRSIFIKDVNNCSADTTVLLTEPEGLLFDGISITQPTCKGFTDGSILVNGMGGTAPYRYAVSGGAPGTTNAMGNLGEGSTTVQLYDANGCVADTTILLQGLPHIIFENIVIENVRCYGGSDGSIALGMSGGVVPLSYSINNSSVAQNPVFSNLAPRSYTIKVTDSAGCTADTNIVIDEPAKITLKATPIPNNCDGPYDGGINIEAEGGTPGYRYAWNTIPPQNGSSLTGVANGVYSVVVKDANECTDSISATVLYNNCCRIFIPDAFTPNNDGMNDKARIKVKGEFILRVFAIYNRFGEKVYESSNLDDGWDGLYKANKADVGTYTYFAKGICGSSGNKEQLYKGTIMLIR